MQKYAKETDIVHGIHTSHITTMDLVPPIHLTSTYRFRDADHGAGIFNGTDKGYAYTRMGNPTVDLFQEKIARCLKAEKPQLPHRPACPRLLRLP